MCVLLAVAGLWGAGMALRRLLQGSVLPRVTGRASALAVAPFSTEFGETIRATLFPGDSIGPEIAESVKQVQNLGSV
jgi:isocitrate dehydrogenase (NAD+)